MDFSNSMYVLILAIFAMLGLGAYLYWQRWYKKQMTKK